MSVFEYLQLYRKKGREKELDYLMHGVSAVDFQNVTVQIVIVAALTQIVKNIIIRYNLDTVWCAPAAIVVGIVTQLIIAVLSDTVTPSSILSGLQYGTLFGLASNGTVDNIKFATKVGGNNNEDETQNDEMKAKDEAEALAN